MFSAVAIFRCSVTDFWPNTVHAIVSYVPIVLGCVYCVCGRRYFVHYFVQSAYTICIDASDCGGSKCCRTGSVLPAMQSELFERTVIRQGAVGRKS